MKKTAVLISILASILIIVFSGLGIYFYLINHSKEERISRIGIGGGGAFLNAMIDPTNENIFYAVSDMGALYYSHNSGETWDRSQARGVFTQTHISKNGIVFAGGYGIHASYDKGKTLQLIYPQNVKYSVSRCGWNESLMIADGYNNGYVKAITSNDESLFFVTIDWEGVLKFFKCDYHGNNLLELYSEQTTFLNPMSDIDVFMLQVESGVYFTLGTKICYYEFESRNLTNVYTTTGYIKDICN